MNIDVGQAIQELLFEQPDVIVPGLGGFTSTPQSATVDYVQGVVVPPTKKIEFNPNLVLNDGVLVNYIQKHHTVTSQEAKEAVDHFVENMTKSLERREIVEIPKVGRLYKDYEHKIRFMPENANLNAATFGLPQVQFAPVARERAESPESGAEKPAKTAATTKTGATPAPAGLESKLQRMLPWLVLASAILLAASLFYIFGSEDDPLRQPLDKTRVNVKPGEKEQLAQDDDTTASATEQESGSQGLPEGQNIPEDAETEINTYEPGKEKAFIVVHSFSKRTNATNFAKLLAEDGYAAENRSYEGLYRVGIIFPYSALPEIDSMKALLGKKYKAGPKLFEELDE
ncbi:MAG: HU family DNA-binding protein [Saprospiraceae bacterium]